MRAIESQKFAVLLIWSLFLAAPATADYEITIEKELQPTGIDAVAIIPTLCPAGLDCKALEKDLRHELSRRVDFRIVESQRVTAAMLELGITDLDEQVMVALATELQVDALLIPVIRHTNERTDPFWRWLILPIPGHGVLIQPTSLRKADAEMVLVSVPAIEVVMHGYGRGQSRVRSRAKMLGDIFAEILDRTFGPPNTINN